MMPFTVEQFFAVFAAYNQSIWPAQVVAYLTGVIAVATRLTEPLFDRRRLADRFGSK